MEGTWNKVAGSRLEPGLFGQSAVEHKGQIYVFGGCDRNGIFYNTLYSWNMSMCGEVSCELPDKMRSTAVISGRLIWSNF